MSDIPFGFGVPPEEPDDGDQGKERNGGEGQGGGQPGGPFGFGGPGGGDNPFAAMFGSLNPNDLGAAFQQLGQMLSYEGGPVNWDMAKDIARQTVAQGTPDGVKDASVGRADRDWVQEALRLADLWLDGATSLPSGAGTAVAWSRAEWVEATLPVWKELVDPVAERVAGAMGDVLPEEMQAMSGPLLGMMRSMGGAMFGSQIGQALGTLAGEVVGSTDVGLPLGPAGKAALLPANVAAFGDGLGVPQEEVRLYLALREAAHQRLFAHVPWLRAHLFGAVEGYARGIKVDTARLEEAVGQLDPSQPEQLQEALQQGMFQPEDTPAQKAALARLETALALVEGWVDAVVHEAAAPHLPSAGALRETLRRRRATGGPAEQTFATLIGLELRPRRLRDASRLWASLTDARGMEGRDGLWAHPDMLPTAADLDDPDGFVHRESFDFSELDQMLGEAAEEAVDLQKKGDGRKESKGPRDPGAEAADSSDGDDSGSDIGSDGDDEDGDAKK
ncbi:putative hydrolase [Streptomyces sp. DvalAA-14]|uniref:zinc-dependent metalloprotease n=1 Tax=unclassified Streptomyces TaxID=2593676 RepID=UPI00081B1D32|nr:zinc-dependent metalloprotease [Streptomyces sp. DvalAA-14]MYS25107.1 hydrolase [Streptomyces sp. SID4948]SCE52227.1 putative hydrolase [Streptomyces sp. DvalAA-14]